MNYLDYYLNSQNKNPVQQTPSAEPSHQLTAEELMSNSYDHNPPALYQNRGPAVPATISVPRVSPVPAQIPQSTQPADMGSLAVPKDILAKARLLEFAAGLGDLGRVIGRDTRRGSVSPPMEWSIPGQASRNVIEAWKSAQPPRMSPLEQLQYAKATQPPAVNVLQQLQTQKLSQELLGTAEDRNPDSRKSKAFRASIQHLYPEFYGSADTEAFENLSYSEMQNPMFQKSIEKFYSNESKQTDSDRLLRRQKELSDYTANQELARAALQGGLRREARELMGKEETAARLDRGGDENRLDGIRNIILSSFPAGSLEERPEIKKAVMDIEGEAFKRGSLNVELTARLKDLSHRVEKDMAYNIPGFTRPVSKDTPELNQQEIKEAREAVSAWQEVQPAIKRLRAIRDSMGVEEVASAKAGYVTENMANAIAITEQLTNNLRVIGNYGVPQAAELARMEKQIPPMNTFSGFINGIRQIEAMNTALTEKMHAKLRNSGWTPRGTISKIPGTTIQRVK